MPTRPEGLCGLRNLLTSLYMWVSYLLCRASALLCANREGNVPAHILTSCEAAEVTRKAREVLEHLNGCSGLGLMVKRKCSEKVGLWLDSSLGGEQREQQHGECTVVTCSQELKHTEADTSEPPGPTSSMVCSVENMARP